MEKLRTHIKKRNITQAQFAKMLGVSDAYLSQILGGSRRPSYSVMVKIETATKGRGQVKLEDWKNERDTE